MCVQTNVKSQMGIGYPIHIHYYAPVDINDPSKPIEYDYREIGDDIDLIEGKRISGHEDKNNEE